MSEGGATPLVLFSWDGKEAPLRLLQRDQTPAFRIALFDYSGRSQPGSITVDGIDCRLLSQTTECKGEIYQALARELADQPCPEFVGLIDDDVLLRVSDINALLHIARGVGLDSFSPCLTHDSHFSYRWTLKRGEALLHRVDFVEVMMPFYRGELFLAGAPHYSGNTSSYGIDAYLMPTLQKLGGWEQTAIVNQICVSHLRPVSSNSRVFKNGRSAFDELRLMQAHCLELIRQQQPALLDSPWKHRVFDLGQQRTLWQRVIARLGRSTRRWLEMSA